MSSTPELYNVADMSLTNVYGFPGMDYLRHNTGKFINNKQYNDQNKKDKMKTMIYRTLHRQLKN